MVHYSQANIAVPEPSLVLKQEKKMVASYRVPNSDIYFLTYIFFLSKIGSLAIYNPQDLNLSSILPI